MSATIVRSAILLIWIGSLVAAFQLGKKSDIGISAQSKNSLEPTLSKTITYSPDGDSSASPGSSSGNSISPATGNEGAKKIANQNINVSALIASMKAEFGSSGGMIYNASAMMRIMAPIADLTEDQIYEALDEVSKTVPAQQQKMMFYQLLLGRLAEADGRKAMEYVTEKLADEKGMYASMIVAVIGTWVQRDPEGAWNWFIENRDQRPSGMMGDNQIQFIFSGLASRDIGDAFRRLEELTDFEQEFAVSGIAMSAAWNPDSRDELLTRAPELPGEQKDKIYQRLFTQWAMTTPREAIEWAGKLPDEDRKKLAKRGGYSLMYAAPELGVKFILDNASEAELPRTYSTIVSQWAIRDPNAAGDWLNELPQGPHLDDARSSFAFTIAPRDPISAMEWAKSVETKTKKFSSIRQVYTRWREKDLQAADSALNSSGLDEEEIAKIREAAAKPKSK